MHVEECEYHMAVELMKSLERIIFCVSSNIKPYQCCFSRLSCRFHAISPITEITKLVKHYVTQNKNNSGNIISNIEKRKESQPWQWDHALSVNGSTLSRMVVQCKLRWWSAYLIIMRVIFPYIIQPHIH